MSEIKITREDKGSKARYVARVAGIDGEGELTLSILSNDTVIADHTEVPDSMRRQGVALALVERLVADAREQEFQIVPLCPFVRAQSVKHQEWTDVIQA